MRTIRALAIAVSVGAPALPVSVQAQLTTIYSFMGSPDGAMPQSGLIALDGNLWGTTFEGGESNIGTVFAIDPASTSETFIYSFAGEPDGALPNGGLATIGSTVYGTTSGGGSHNGGACTCGTVFAVDTAAGAETVVHSFTREQGFDPFAGVTYADGALYGITPLGGHDFAGTIFRIDPATGSETVLVHFYQQMEPRTALLYSGGYLYGTGYVGGGYGHGSVFRLKPAPPQSSFQTLYRFQSGTDGGDPSGNLVPMNGVIYGTTQAGGGTACDRDAGCGTVFGITPSEYSETFHFSFHLAHGATPLGGVIYEQGELFGTTSEGGASGDGTVFELDPATGVAKVLVSFDGTNGARPSGPLLCYQGNLYGTTSAGGAANAGTVFEYQPTTPLKC